MAVLLFTTRIAEDLIVNITSSKAKKSRVFVVKLVLAVKPKGCYCTSGGGVSDNFEAEKYYF